VVLKEIRYILGLDAPKSLAAVEAIVAKYLTPKSSLTKTTKRLIKRPHGVSVTDLDVVGENIVKKKKKDDTTKKTTTKTSSKPTKPATPSKFYPSQVHNTPSLQSNNSYLPQSQYAHSNIHHLSPLTSSSYATQAFPAQTSSYVLQQLQNASSSNATGCGSCYQSINSLYLGGYCTQCSVPICWSCWSNVHYNIYYCNSCRLG
jgi:hypothetical protein